MAVCECTTAPKGEYGTKMKGTNSRQIAALRYVCQRWKTGVFYWEMQHLNLLIFSHGILYIYVMRDTVQCTHVTNCTTASAKGAHMSRGIHPHDTTTVPWQMYTMTWLRMSETRVMPGYCNTHHVQNITCGSDLHVLQPPRKGYKRSSKDHD